MIIVVLFATSLLVFSQPMGLKYGSDRDVMGFYKGWEGDPDTITVHIDTSSYSDAQQDSIRAAIARWNAAGCIPKLKEVDTVPANVNIIESDTLDDSTAGLAAIMVDTNTLDVTGVNIYINDSTDPLSLKEVVTHELGHALGLDDTEEATNPSDVMRGTGGSNGTNGGLSAHDSAELIAAGAAAVAIEKVDEQAAINPPLAILPGEFAMLEFDLGTVYPPDVIDQTSILVTPIGDPYLFIETAFIEENLLIVGVFSEPNHWSGKIYLEIELLFPEPYPIMQFWGTHFINAYPAEPVIFDCPFTFNEDDGLVHINWVDECTYPLEHSLRSVLVVDGAAHYKQRGGGNYTLTLEPGEHLFELFVNDHQINNAYSAQNIFVTGIPKSEEQTANYTIYPNPFNEVCTFDCPDGNNIKIFDITGKLIIQLQEGAKQWKPSAGLPFGIYFIQFRDGQKTKTLKVIYRK